MALRGAPADVWTKVTSPHFTILTSAGESTAREWATVLEEFRRGMQAIVPVPVDKLRPVTVVLFKTDKAMEPYLPLEKGKPARIGGYFVRANEINVIMLSLDGGDEEVRHTIFHEAVHWHLSAFEGPMPLWLGEGLAELYATFKLTDEKTYTFGAPLTHAIRLLRREPLMPLSRLFGTGTESLLYNEGDRASIFYAQSWALVHFILFGEGSPGRDSIMRYLELLPTAQSADEAFVTAFGTNHGAIEKRLRTYIMRGSYRMHRYPRTTADIAKLLKVSRAAPGDIEQAKGLLLLGAQKTEAAEASLRRAVVLAPKDPRGWELLGQIALERKDYTEALEVLTKAMAAGSTNYLVYHNLGVSYFPPSMLPNVAFVAHDPVQMDKAAASFRMAIQLAPAHVESYEGLAGMMHGMQSQDPGDMDLLARGARLAPNNARIEAGIAAGEFRAGRGKDGRERLERLLAKHGDSEEGGVRFARKMLANEVLKVEMEEIDRLAKQSRFDEALAVVDRGLARDLEAAHRQALETAQRSLRSYRTIAGAVERANRGEVEAARKALDELLADKPERAIKADAERLLREITRHEERVKRRAEREN
ncbi:MAG: tetratricopeptide repeat protein [Verrucomicrobiota bacterium]